MLYEAKQLWIKRAASTLLLRSKLVIAAGVTALVLLVTTIVLWDDLDGVFERHPPVPHLSVWPQPASEPHPSLAVIIPISKHTDVRFYRNMWMGNHGFTICETHVPGCSMVCGRKPEQTSAQADVDCLVRVAKGRFSETEFIVRMSDDMLVDRSYVFSIMKEYKAIDTPMYVSSAEQTDTSVSGFYMFNQALAKCISDQDLSFAERVDVGCGKNVKRVVNDETKVWQTSYTNKNKYINLAA
ncbi:hypothetical protein GGH96_003935 [Coemansia sp. RSA 1972]|nr:hypothetical protein GGH96_003935 [Coemansia sp. RSA 1972]